MAKVFTRIVIHCSDSDFGNMLLLRQWHLARGFKDIGYHYIIANGYPTKDWNDKNIILPLNEGSVEVGRPITPDDIFDENEIGAHVEGFNTGSLGICMIGSKSFSPKVLNTCISLVRFHLSLFNLQPAAVFGHYELDKAGKTCPNIDMNIFRKNLTSGIDYTSAAIFGAPNKTINK
jgi:N-acetylmuramoyl-L-alanine amidase